MLIVKKQIICRWVTIFILVTIISLVGCTPAQNQPGNPNATPGPNNTNTTQDNENYNMPGTTRISDNTGTNDFRRMVDNNNNYNTNNRGIGNNRMNDNFNNMSNNTDVNRLGATDIGNQQMGTQGSNVNTTAQNIKSKLEARDDIERASCVISGDTALIGIDVKDGMNNTANIKNEVTNMVKNMIPGITKVAVTESPDLFERINNLSRDMQNGRTMQGLGEEFTELVNKIIPTVR